MPFAYVYNLKGQDGDPGSPGPAPTFAVTSVSTVAYGTTPQITIAEDQNTANLWNLSLEIPTGPAGGPGPAGPSGGFVIRHKYGSYDDFISDTDPETNYGFTSGDLALIGGDDQEPEYGQMWLYKGAGNGTPGTQNQAWQYLVDLSTQGVEGRPGDNATIELAATHFTTNDPNAVGVTNIGTQTNAVLQFTIPKGDKGDPGNTGNGISSLTQAADNLTMEFTFTDQTTKTISLPRGQDGDPGPQGISVISALVNTNVDDNTKYDLVFGRNNGADNIIATFDKPLDGTAATIAPGNASTLSYGATPTVTNTGTSNAAVFDFGIPQGAPGVDAANIDSIAIAEDPNNSANWELTVTMDDADAQGQNATTYSATFAKPADGADGAGITNVTSVDANTIRIYYGTNPNDYVDIDTPRGVDGPSGAIQINSVTTGAPGSNATVTIDPSSTFNAANNATLAKLNFTIPRGDTGAVVELDELNDVDLTTTAPADGDVLQYDGTNFVPGTSPIVYAIALG